MPEKPHAKQQDEAETIRQLIGVNESIKNLHQTLERYFSIINNRRLMEKNANKETTIRRIV